MSLPRQVLLIAGLALLPALGTGWKVWPLLDGEPALRPYEVTLEEVAGWPDPVLWIDARPSEAFQRAHVPGALSLPESEWESGLAAVLEAWSPEHRVLVYCAETACSTSVRVAERLRADLGSENVYYLRGGFEAWQATR